MSSDATSDSPDKYFLMRHLSWWAARLTTDPDEQRQLIDQTIAVAIYDSEVLDAEDVDAALERVMQRLTSWDLPAGCSGSPLE
ncbi:hypothetical protein HHL25_19460 [Rhizobium sp. S-51]|jgi:hypothetical protein|uniref:Uncharacterized protein n=1 Tax=Rhizobium terricola TaxID=2728849 RepID=A0A7Y0AZD8_9HYPH|nr:MULTISPECIES: hypothetical protein [Rhizobiaceae]NML76315.1 hypothetical protein [Rhizobium terricola]SSX47545.1 unnamed protein product [Ciceribacter naphthalenivorans]